MTRNQVETCLICDKMPCECFVAKKAARKLPVPKSTLPQATSPPVVESPSLVVPQRTGLLATTQVQKAKVDRDVGDAEMRRALTVLCRSGLIHWEDIEAHQHELNMTSQEARLLIWKQKRLAMIRR